MYGINPVTVDSQYKNNWMIIFSPYFIHKNTILYVCEFFVCEENLDKNQYYPTIVLPQKLPTKFPNMGHEALGRKLDHLPLHWIHTEIDCL